MATKRKTIRRKVTFSRYDTADYLKSEADIAGYLAAAIEEAGDDAAFIAAVLGDIARARGMMELAKAPGITREGLYKALAADSNPSFATVLKVMKALGLQFDVRVTKAA